MAAVLLLGCLTGSAQASRPAASATAPTAAVRAVQALESLPLDPAELTRLAAGLSQAARRGSALVETALSFGPLRTTLTGDATATELSLGSAGCRPGAAVQVAYDQSFGATEFADLYTGPMRACRLAQNDHSGALVVRWGPQLNLALAFSAAGRVQTLHERIARRCTLSLVFARYRARGRLDASLHADTLGAFRVRRLSAQLLHVDYPACAVRALDRAGGASLLSTGSGSGATSGSGGSGAILQARFDDHRASLVGIAIAGSPSIVTLSEAVPDAPIRGVRDTLEIATGGNGAFVPGPGLSRAEMTFDSPAINGSLSFAPEPGCPAGVRAQDGSLTGSLTVQDPVYGALTFTGAQMGLANLSRLGARYTRCRGFAGGSGSGAATSVGVF